MQIKKGHKALQNKPPHHNGSKNESKLSHFQCERKQNTSYASARGMRVVAFSNNFKKSANGTESVVYKFCRFTLFPVFKSLSAKKICQ